MYSVHRSNGGGRLFRNLDARLLSDSSRRSWRRSIPRIPNKRRRFFLVGNPCWVVLENEQRRLVGRRKTKTLGFCMLAARVDLHVCRWKPSSRLVFFWCSFLFGSYTVACFVFYVSFICFFRVRPPGALRAREVHVQDESIRGYGVYRINSRELFCLFAESTTMCVSRLVAVLSPDDWSKSIMALA